MSQMPKIKLTIKEKPESEEIPVFVNADEIYFMDIKTNVICYIDAETGNIEFSSSDYKYIENNFKKMRIKEIILEDWD